MARRVERLLLRLVFWLFRLTEEPRLDPVGSDCPCIECCRIRRMRRGT